jgi:hypothetical protein
VTDLYWQCISGRLTRIHVYVCIYDYLVHLTTHAPFYRSPTGTFENCEITPLESSQIAGFCLRMQYLHPINTLWTIRFCSVTSLHGGVSHRAYRPSRSKSMRQHPNHLQCTLTAPLCSFIELLGASAPPLYHTSATPSV